MKIYFALLITTLSTLIVSSTSAQVPFYWDAGASGGASLGGTGNWDTNSADPNTAIWYNGSADVVWTNSNNHDAYFTGTAGTVTIVDGEQISADDLYFTNDTGIYDITNSTGAEVLNVANNIDTGGGEAIIGATIGNSTTLNKNGNGRLHLTVDSSAALTGNVMVNQGELSIETNNAAGLGTPITVANGAALELNGGYTNLYNDINLMTVSGTGITNNGALVNVSGYSILNGTLTLAGPTEINVANGEIIYDANSAQGAGAPITGGGGNYNVLATGNGEFYNGSQGFNIGTGTITVQGNLLFVQYVTSAYANNMIFSGVYVGTNCTYDVEDDGDFGTVPSTPLVTTNVILDGGTLGNFGSYTMSTNRGITATINGGSISNASGTFITCNIYSSNGPVTFSGSGSFRPGGAAGTTYGVLNFGTGALIKNGSGDINMGYANPSLETYSNVVLLGGSYSFNYDQSSGQISGLGALPSSIDTSNIWFSGGSLHVGHSTTIGTARGMYIAAGGGTIEDVVSSGGTVTIDSIISGPGNMNFPDGHSGTAATTVLVTNNTYTGTTTIGAQCTVTVGSGSSYGTLGTGNTTVNGVLNFNRTGSYTYNGNISGTSNIINSGSGVITLTGASTYSGATIVSAGTLLMDNTNASAITVASGGTLGGSGVFGGTVTVSSGGTLALGTGTLSASNNVSLAGNVTVSVNNSASPSSGMAIVTGTLSGTSTGKIIVSNVGPALTTGNSFQLFSQSVSSGNSMSISGGGVVWNNNLASSGSISVAGPLPVPVINSVFLSGTNLVLSGTNGYATGGYYVLSSTNLLLPLSSWTPVLTNTFVGSGTFSVTNPMLPGIHDKFYTIKLQ